MSKASSGRISGGLAADFDEAIQECLRSGAASISLADPQLFGPDEHIPFNVDALQLGLAIVEFFELSTPFDGPFQNGQLIGRHRHHSHLGLFSSGQLNQYYLQLV